MERYQKISSLKSPISGHLKRTTRRIDSPGVSFKGYAMDSKETRKQITQVQQELREIRNQLFHGVSKMY